jgi:hypothetical protein
MAAAAPTARAELLAVDEDARVALLAEAAPGQMPALEMP